jgi:hypothetical protein
MGTPQRRHIPLGISGFSRRFAAYRWFTNLQGLADLSAINPRKLSGAATA